jgi:hypothetical protein
MALLIFTITQNQLWLALMIGSYLLRPTLASLGIAKRNVDERQLSIHYRSSNIAFVVMMITCVYFAATLSAEGNPAWETYNMVIVVGLAAKALFNVMLVKSPREAATKIIITVGLLMALFGGMGSVESGVIAVFMNSLLGLVFLTIGLLSKRFPRAIGVVVILATVVLLIIFFGDGALWAEIGTALLIGVPLILAGICLYLEPREVALEVDESKVDPAL